MDPLGPEQRRQAKKVFCWMSGILGLILWLVYLVPELWLPVVTISIFVGLAAPVALWAFLERQRREQARRPGFVDKARRL